jgi:hypothetical protein
MTLGIQMIHHSNLPRRAGKIAAWRRRGAALPLLTPAILLVAIAMGRAEEFIVTSRWQYPATPLANGRLLAHGQADIFDTSTNAQLGGIGFYCTPTQNYVDVFVHVSGVPIISGNPAQPVSDLRWGRPTFKTRLKLGGVDLPAAVESGVVYVDIDAKTGPVLAEALALKPGTPSKRLDFDVAKLAAFTLVMKPIEPRMRPANTLTLDYARMVDLCRSMVAGRAGN